MKTNAPSSVYIFLMANGGIRCGKTIESNLVEGEVASKKWSDFISCVKNYNSNLELII